MHIFKFLKKFVTLDCPKILKKMLKKSWGVLLTIHPLEVIRLDPIMRTDPHSVHFPAEVVLDCIQDEVLCFSIFDMNEITSPALTIKLCFIPGFVAGNKSVALLSECHHYPNIDLWTPVEVADCF